MTLMHGCKQPNFAEKPNLSKPKIATLSVQLAVLLYCVVTLCGTWKVILKTKHLVKIRCPNPIRS